MSKLGKLGLPREWVRIHVLALQEAQVRALVEEQRSCMPGLRARKNKNKKTRILSYGMETHALQVLTPSDSALGSLDVAPSRSDQQTGTRQRAVPLEAARTPPCPGPPTRVRDTVWLREDCALGGSWLMRAGTQSCLGGASSLGSLSQDVRSTPTWTPGHSADTQGDSRSLNRWPPLWSKLKRQDGCGGR